MCESCILCRIQKVLSGSQEEVEVLIKNYQSTAQLASFLVVLRRDYDALKASKATVRKEKDKLAQEITYLKRKVRRGRGREIEREGWKEGVTLSVFFEFQVQSKGEELQSTRSQLSMLETDLHAAEKERESLAKKVEMLERALESPGSKVALRRILERSVLFGVVGDARVLWSFAVQCLIPLGEL